MKVAVYTRVSTKHEEQISSLEHQQETYLEYCDKNNYNLVKLYADAGLSAVSTNRRNFLQMINDAGLDYEKAKDSKEILYFKLAEREPKFKMIITKDVSRFSRNIDTVKLVKQLKEKGVIILFENAGFSTDDKDYELRLSLLLTFSQQESIDRSNKVAFAYKQRSKNGTYHMVRNLLGYTYNKETKETTINEQEAKTVRLMFDLYLQGNGVKNIATYLNERNITTQNGKQWLPANVRRLLRNQKYIGIVVLNRFTNSGITGSNKKIERPKDEWIIHHDAIPSIISQETWDQAQEIMAKRVKSANEGSLSTTGKVKNIFYNKLFCEKCGSRFVRITSHKRRKSGNITAYFYECSNRRYLKTCDNKMISHDTLVKKVNNFSKNELPAVLEEKRENKSKWIETKKKILEINRKTSANRTSKIKEEIADIDSKIDKLISAIYDSSETVVSVIKKKIEELENKKQELNKRLLELDIVEIESKQQTLTDLQEELKDILDKKDSYSFKEALDYIAWITCDEDELKFNVEIGEKLNPKRIDDVNEFINERIEKMQNSLNAMDKIENDIDRIKEQLKP